MKRNLIALAGAAALAVAGLGAAATLSAASAASKDKAPVILILNQAQVLAQSKAGQSIGPQLEKLQKEANDDFNDEVEKVVKEGEDLKKQKDLMAEEVWIEKAKQVSVKQNNLPTLRDVKVRELSISEQKAVSDITEVMKPILKDIVDDRGATILLDRSAVMYASVDTDITAEVISALDKKIQSVKVEKISMEDLQRQAQAAQAAQQKKK